MKPNIRMLAAATLGACAASLAPALAAENAATPPVPDTSNWACRFCPEPAGWFGHWDLGLLYADGTTPRFGDYRGIDDDGAYLDAVGDVGYRGASGLYLDARGRDLGLESPRLMVRGGRQGSYEVRVDYREIPRYLGNGTVTPYLGVGTDRLTLPAEGEPVTFRPATLEREWKDAEAGLTFRLGRAWTFEAGLERQEKSGTRPLSGGLFATSAALFPAPVDHTTDRVNAAIQYAGDTAQLRLGFAASDFNNGYGSVTWDSPFALGFGDETARSALAPDNRYHQFNLVGAVRVASWLRFSGKASVGEAEQDDPLLPYTVNPRYADRELPRLTLDGRVDTSIFNASGRLHARLARGVDLTAQWKTSERDNKTPVDLYDPVLLEVIDTEPRSNRPYGYDRDQARIELRLRPANRLRLNGGWKRDTVERTYQQVEETEEDTLWGEVQWSALDTLDARLRYETGDRTATPLEQVGNFGRAENPLLRKFNLAERDRDRGVVELDWMPLERFGASFSAYATDDRYGQSILGLRDSEETSFSLDLHYVFGDQATLYAFASHDRVEATLSGAEDIGATPWTSSTDDTILTWGFGASGQLTEKLGYGVDWVWSDSEGDIFTDDGSGDAPFPTLETELRYLRAYVNYALAEHWSLGLDAYHESYRTADWTLDGIGPTDVTNLLGLGEVSPDYDATVVRLLATYRF